MGGMRLIRASFASMALIAFASAGCRTPAKSDDTFKRVAGQYDTMPVPNAPVVEPKVKSAKTAGKPEEVKPQEAKPPEFAKPAKQVPEDKIGKKYEKIKTLDNGYVLLESNTGWLIVKDGEREIAKGKIIKKETSPFRIIFSGSTGLETAIGQDGIFDILPVDTGGKPSQQPSF